MNSKVRGFMGMALAMAVTAEANRKAGYPIEEEKDWRPVDNSAQREKALAKSRKKQGLEEFKFRGVSVWARNKKNALRKAKNLNLI